MKRKLTYKNSLNLKHKTILVTGGTGSFGKALVNVLLKKYKVKKLIIFSRDEFKQYEMENELKNSGFKNYRFFIGDVRDVERLKLAFKEIDIGSEDGLRDEMIKKANGRRTVPQIFIDDYHVGGYQELRELEKQNKLKELLN